jgi:hypothetical protein
MTKPKTPEIDSISSEYQQLISKNARESLDSCLDGTMAMLVSGRCCLKSEGQVIVAALALAVGLSKKMDMPYLDFQECLSGVIHLLDMNEFRSIYDGAVEVSKGIAAANKDEAVAIVPLTYGSNTGSGQSN